MKPKQVFPFLCLLFLPNNSLSKRKTIFLLLTWLNPVSELDLFAYPFPLHETARCAAELPRREPSGWPPVQLPCSPFPKFPGKRHPTPTPCSTVLMTSAALLELVVTVPLELARRMATCYLSADQKSPKLLAAASVPLSPEPCQRRVILFFPSSLLIT